MKSVIMHVDVNSAFLSWEAVYRIHHLGGKTDLRNEVAAVGGDMAARHGIILAKSIPSKKYGIQTGESIVEARRKCPQLTIVPPNYQLYDRCSKALLAILRQYTDCVEQYSIDEAYLDMTGTQNLWGEPGEAADRIRSRIFQELGFTVNAGISHNKLLAKMASGMEKPDRTHTLWKHEIEEKMWPLPVGSLFFVGRATERRLLSLGIRTIGELARSDIAMLKSHFGRHGEVIWAFAHGIDLSVVQPAAPDNKGYGNSTTIAFDVTDASTAKLVLLSLAETVAARLRAANVKASVIAVGIRTFDLQYKSHQTVLENATNITAEIHRWACRLFDEAWDGTPIRHLGIHTSRIRDGSCMRQLNLFDHNDYEKLERWDMTIDQIRERFGNDSIKRAVFANQHALDHMAGGISREKRSVDYEKVKIE